MKKIVTLSTIFFLGLVMFLGPISPAIVHAQNTGETDVTQDYGQFENKLPGCAIAGIAVSGSGGGDFMGCMVELAYGGLVASAWFAATTAGIFDYFINYSIDSDTYDEPFIEKGWSVIRDIANVMFIFMLLYIAIRHILQFATANTKRLLTTLIIAALLINFSLFFTRVITDIGNVTARAFYNQITVENDDNEEYKSVAQGLAAKINPQELLSSGLLKIQHGTEDANDNTNNSLPDSGYIFFIFLLGIVINGTIGWVFLSVFLFFIARAIGLWFMMIFSPIAFASLALPNQGAGLKQFGWKGWKDTTIQLSFMAPVFVFLLYLTIMFLDIVLSTGVNANDNPTNIQEIMRILIPLVIVLLVLTKARDIAKKMAGEFGEGVQKAVKKVAMGTALVGGAAVFGGAALAGRAIGGKMASKTLASGKYQNQVKDYGKLAKKAKKAGDKTAYAKHRASQEAARGKVNRLQRYKTSTWDLRSSRGIKKVTDSGVGKLVGQGGSKLFGSVVGEDSTKLSLGKGQTQTQEKKERALDTKRKKQAELYDDKTANMTTLKQISYAANKGSAGSEETLKLIDKHIQELDEAKKKGIIDSDTYNERKEHAESWEALAKSGGESDMELIIKGNDDVRGVKKTIKVEVEERRDEVANMVENAYFKNVSNGVSRSANKATADAIRGGVSSKTTESKFKDIIKDLTKEKEDKD